MSENHARRWRSGSLSGGVPGTDTNRMIGRVFFSIIAISLLVMLVVILWPVPLPRNWVVTFSGQPLDDLTLAIPYAKDDSESWIPKSASGLYQRITDVASDAQFVQEIESLKDHKEKPNAQDNLVVYLVGYGINDDPAVGPQIVVKANSKSEAAENGGKDNKISDVNHVRIPVDKLLKALVDLPFKSILLVVDCSRTLDCPRWGWEQSGTFPKGMDSVVTNFNGTSGPEMKKAEKLWVISASDSRQLGLVLQNKKHSLFGWAWHQSLSNTVKESKKRPKTVELKEFFGKLRDSIGGTVTEKSPPLLFHGGRGLVDQTYASKNSHVIWYGNVADIDSPPSKEITPDDIEKKKDRITRLKTAKAEELTGLMEEVGLSPEIRNFLGLWKLVDEVQSGESVTGIPNLDAETPNPGVDQLLSPLVYAPHLWRRLKWQLVADESAVLAGQSPRFSFESYKNELSNLKKWPRNEPSVSSITVFDQLNIAWHHHTKYKSEHATLTNNEKKERELLAAHRQYADVLFAFSEMSAIENRLASVSNVKPFSRAENVELDKAAEFLSRFYRMGFEARETNLEQQIENVIAMGKSLQDWKVKALGEWFEFARPVADELKDGINPRSNWNTLELLLTSSLWSTEQRLQWRIAQSFLNANAASTESMPGESTKLPNHSGMVELIKKIGDGVEPFPKQSSGLPKWYRDLAERANEISGKEGRNSPRAYFLAALSDPRDSRRYSEPYAIWLESKLHPRSEPDYFSLEMVSADLKTPDGKTPEAKPDAVKPPPEPINLDSAPAQTPVPGQNTKFKFMVCWKPSRDKKSGEFPKVILKATFDESWISTSREKEVVFDGTEPLKEDGTYQKAIEWSVAMVKDKSRVRPDEPRSAVLRIDFDESDLEKQNQSRKSLPRLQVERSKASVQSLVIMRNRRSVSLSLRQGNWNHTRRSPVELDIFEVPLLAGRETSFEWRVKNESPIGVSVTAQLWTVNRPDEWTSPWGRIPADNVIDERKYGSDRPKDKSPLAEYKFPSLGVGEDQVISWTAPASGAKEPQLIDVTQGLYCRLSVDADEQATRDYWIELIPRSPRRWLTANATVTSAGATDPSVFDINITRQDNIWPWQAYPKLNFSKLKATLTLPQGWTDVNGTSTEIPGPTRQTGHIGVEFPPKVGANDQPTFLDVDGWHRAFRWQTKVFPGVNGEQNFSETFRLNFTKITFQSPGITPTAPAVVTAYDSSSENWKVRPFNVQYPIQKNLAASKLYVSFEADALENYFNPNGDCGELRIEQLFDQARPQTLFARRADRDWTTKCVVNMENPDRLVFKSIVSDFDDIELENLESIVPSERLVTLRASFYAAGAKSPSQADDAGNQIQLLFDGTRPKVEMGNYGLDQKGTDLIASLKLIDDRGMDPGSGVKEVRCWLRSVSSNLRPLTPTELEMPSFSTAVKKGQADLDIRIPILVPPENRKFLLIRVSDRVGLEGELEKDISQLSPPNMAPGGKLKDGVIQGKLSFPTGKAAENFTIRLSDPASQDSERKTNANGEFRFDKLDRDVEYSLTVKSQFVGSTNYGLSQPKKIKPKVPGSGVNQEQIDLIDLSSSKK